MRVIKSNNIEPEYPKRVFCDECQAELEIDESDVFVGEFGCYMFKCPCCGREVAIDGIGRDMKPTFRKTFFHYSVTKEGTVPFKHIPDNEVQEMIDKCVHRLISEDVEVGEYTMEAIGDTAVYAFKYEDCMDIIVTQDYYNDTLFDDDYGLIRKED